MSHYFGQLNLKIRERLWQKSQENIFFRLILAFYAVLYYLGGGYITMCAKSLVYTTLLSLVPLLAVSFSFLKAFGVHNQVKPLLMEALSPLGEKGVEISNNILGFIDNVNAGVLGVLGILILLYTVVSVISTVESALNTIWHVTRPRSVTQRVSYYLSVIIFAPVLVFSGVGIMASLLSADVVQSILAVEPFGSLYYLLVLFSPYLLLTLAFLLVYIFLPNVKVDIKAALVGAIVAAILWRIAGEIFAQFVVDSSNYAAIYSGFATLILFLIWLFISWLIFLLGGQLAYFYQFPEMTLESNESTGPEDYRTRLVLMVMYMIGSRHLKSEERWNIPMLVKQFNHVAEDVRETVNYLVSCNLLVIVDDDRSSILLAKDMENISIYHLLKISKKLPIVASKNIHLSCEPVDQLLSRVDSLLEKGLEGSNMKNWITPTAS